MTAAAGGIPGRPSRVDSKTFREILQVHPENQANCKNVEDRTRCWMWRREDSRQNRSEVRRAPSLWRVRGKFLDKYPKKKIKSKEFGWFGELKEREIFWRGSSDWILCHLHYKRVRVHLFPYKAVSDWRNLTTIKIKIKGRGETRKKKKGKSIKKNNENQRNLDWLLYIWHGFIGSPESTPGSPRPPLHHWASLTFIREDY